MSKFRILLLISLLMVSTCGGGDKKKNLSDDISNVKHLNEKAKKRMFDLINDRYEVITEGNLFDHKKDIDLMADGEDESDKSNNSKE